MEKGVLSPGNMLGVLPDTAMDLDFMDEIFLDGCWLETTDGSQFLNQSPATSSALLDPSLVWSALEANGNVSSSLSQKDNQVEAQRPLPDESQERSLVNTPSLGQNPIFSLAGYSVSENNVTEGSELGTRWWIAPRGNPGSTSSVTERLIKAIGYIREFTRDRDVLIQIWVPVNREGRRILTTSNQPFLLGSDCTRMARYRDISGNFVFSAEKDSEVLVGLPGRVFLDKVPEWTPDVRFFRSDEYLRVNHAQEYAICGTLALPIFEQGSNTCLGVIEVVMTKRHIKYRSEVESVRKALEAVDLRSTDALSADHVKAFNKAYQAALPETLEVLKSACKRHRLPLAQTWVPCIQQGKEGCRHSDENYLDCVSTVDHACVVANPNMQGFHEACSEHHLLKGQGIVGRAFRTNQPCFSEDIASFGKTDYPLSHHAKVFGLRAAVAIHLRSIHTGTADFVLEFFLPVDCTDHQEQKKMLSSLSVIIQQVCQSLRVVTDKELKEDAKFAVSGKPSSEETLNEKSSEFWHHQREPNIKRNAEFGEGCSAYEEGSFPINRAGEKRRTKAEKTITLEVLKQYFAGSLKDAARTIGVCPTTLKRICRQHGIKRWPSRKIKKVGHSLRKLQVVIDSVQGASGAFQIDSFYTNFQELASPNLQGTSPFSASKLNDHPQLSSMQLEGRILSPQAAASKSPSSSCSQGLSSSQCCSSGTHQHPSTFNVAGFDDPVIGENIGDGVLKRIRSEAELLASSQGPKLLARSRSHKSLSEHPNAENLLPLKKDSGRLSQEGDALRVKVTYGDEKVRFRLQNNWKYTDLLLEIARRFDIDDINRFDLKYLDDDAEWILLTCDADLEECIDVGRSSQGQTIKLCLQVSHYQTGKS